MIIVLTVIIVILVIMIVRIIIVIILLIGAYSSCGKVSIESRPQTLASSQSRCSCRVSGLKSQKGHVFRLLEKVLGPRVRWGFPKIRGTLLGVPIIRTIVFLGLYWGSPILGNQRVAD